MHPAEPDSPDGGAQTVEPVVDVLLADGHQQQFGFGENQLRSGGTKGHLQNIRTPQMLIQLAGFSISVWFSPRNSNSCRSLTSVSAEVLIHPAHSYPKLDFCMGPTTLRPDH